MIIQPVYSMIRKELHETKIRYICLLFGSFLASSIFFIPRILGYDKSFFNVLNILLPVYTAKYSGLSTNLIEEMIITDISLPILIIVPAVVSPFLGILESIITEKQNRTLEILLSLPISDMQILIGKMGTSFLSGLLIAWVLFVAHMICIGYIWSGKMVVYLLSAKWIIFVLIVIPLISFIVNAIGLILAISSRTINTAVHLSFIFLSPFLAIPILLSMGIIIFDTDFVLHMIILSFPLVCLSLGISKQLFDRQRLILHY